MAVTRSRTSTFESWMVGPEGAAGGGLSVDGDTDLGAPFTPRGCDLPHGEQAFQESLCDAQGVGEQLFFTLMSFKLRGL